MLAWWAQSTLFSQLPPPGAGPRLAFQGQRARLPLCPLHLTNLPVPHLNAHLPTDRQMRRRTSWMGVDGPPRAGCDKLAWRHAANAIKTTRCTMRVLHVAATYERCVIAGGCMRRLMSMCYRPQHNENNMRTVRIHDPEIENNASLRTCASHVWFAGSY